MFIYFVYFVLLRHSNGRRSAPALEQGDYKRTTNYQLIDTVAPVGTRELFKRVPIPN